MTEREELAAVKTERDSLQAEIRHSAQFHHVWCNGGGVHPIGGGGVSICNCIGFWRRAERERDELRTALEALQELLDGMAVHGFAGPGPDSPTYTVGKQWLDDAQAAIDAALKEQS